MKSKLFLVLFLMNGLFLGAQVGVSAGFSLLKGFGVKMPYGGMHIGVEIPRDDQVTFYGRFTTTLMNKDAVDGTNYTYVTARDVSTNPYQLQVYYQNKMNYNIIEGGTRYYIGEGYDSGFAAYGGANFSLAISSVKRKYDEYDEVKYELPSTEIPKGTIFSIGAGLAGGVKYTFAGIGSIYFDADFSYLLLSQANNTTAASTNSYSRLFFLFGIGFRKEIY